MSVTIEFTRTEKPPVHQFFHNSIPFFCASYWRSWYTHHTAKKTGSTWGERSACRRCSWASHHHQQWRQGQGNLPGCDRSSAGWGTPWWVSGWIWMFQWGFQCFGVSHVLSKRWGIDIPYGNFSEKVMVNQWVSDWINAGPGTFAVSTWDGITCNVLWWNGMKWHVMKRHLMKWNGVEWNSTQCDWMERNVMSCYVHVMSRNAMYCHILSRNVWHAM